MSESQSTRRKQSRRLFFALWPDSAVRKEVDARSSTSCGASDGRRIAADNYHITLHFLGNTAPDQKRCYSQAAASVQQHAFRLKLDHFGYFTRPGVLWMGVHKEDALTSLYHGLGQALERCGYKCENRKYSPHLSLIRRCRQPGKLESGFAIDWQVSRFALVESVQTRTGVEYRLVESYPLRQS